VTPRWKIRHEDGVWVVRRLDLYNDGILTTWRWTLVAQYLIWENALTHTEIR
jgi:hypothetical protein